MWAVTLFDRRSTEHDETTTTKKTEAPVPVISEVEREH